MSMAMKVARNTPGRAMPGTGYRGDPGLFGFLGKVGRGIAGGISGFARGGPLGAASGLISSFKGNKPRGGRRGTAPFPVQPLGRGFQLPQRPKPGVIGRIQRALPGGETGFMDEFRPPGPGYRMNKSGYFVKADPLDPNSPGVWIPKESVWVKIRHRNPLNPRALSKAIGRVGSAKKATTMLGRITIRKAC